MARNIQEADVTTGFEGRIFPSQFGILFWKLCITARRHYLRTLICLLSPLIMVTVFHFTFSDFIVKPELCSRSKFPSHITLDVYTSFGYLLHVILIVYRLAGERYHQRQTLLFVMGCQKASYYLSNVVFDLIITLIIATYLAISLHYLVLVCTYLPFLILTYHLHAIQAVAFCYMFCYNCLFNTESQPPSTWIAIFILIWTLGKSFRIVAEFQLGTPTGIVNTVVTILNCMIPQAALYEVGKQVIFNTELRFDGLFTSFEHPVIGSIIPLGYVWLAILATIILYFVISWLYLRDDYESKSSLFTNEANRTIKSRSSRKGPTYQMLSTPPQPDTYLALDRNNPADLVNISQFFKSDLLLEDEPINLERGITVKNVSKWFPNSITKGFTKVVDNLSLTVYEGQITILLGHNGAGKTTLMELITGLRHCNSGEITIAGKLPSDAKDRQSARLSVGYCPQASIIFPELTVLEHLQLFCGIKSFQSNEKNNIMIKSILASVRLQSKENCLVHQLSGGMVRKLSLAIALVGAERQILILDEPSSGLDPESRESIWDIIRIYGRSKAILITTQHMEEADHLGDRVAIMSRGKIVCCGSNVFLKDLLGNGYIVRLALKTNSVDLVRAESAQRNKIKNYMRDLLAKCLAQTGLRDARNKSVNELKIVTRQVRAAIQQQSSGEESDYGQDLTIAIDALFEMINTHAPQLNYEKFFSNLESSQSSLNIESFGIASSTMEDVFNNISVLANICYGKGVPYIGNKRLTPVTVGYLNDERRVFAIDELSSHDDDHVADTSKFCLSPNDTIIGYQLALRHVKLTFLRHVIITRNNIGSYFGQRFLYLILVYFITVTIVRVRVRAQPEIQQDVTTMTIYITTPFFLAFMASHYIYLSNRDKVIDDSKFLQHMAGLSPMVYWPIQYLFDLPSMVLNAIILVLCIKWVDYTKPFIDNDYYTTWDVWISLTFLVTGFSSASALISYSISGYFKSSSMALISMTIYYSSTFFVATGATIFRSSRLYTAYLFWATLMNPGFALIDGIRKFYATSSLYENNANTDIIKPSASDSRKISEALQRMNITPDSSDLDIFKSMFSTSRPIDVITNARKNLFTDETAQGVYLNFASIFLWNFLGLLMICLDEYGYNPADLLPAVQKSIGRYYSWIKSMIVNDKRPMRKINDVAHRSTLIEIDPSVEKEKERVRNLLIEAGPNVAASPSDMARKRLHSIDCSPLSSVGNPTTGSASRKASVLPMLASELRKTYGHLVAVRSLSLALNREECLGLLGINGAGKSTTFSMISTKIKPDSGGQLRCLGYCPKKERYLYRKQLGYDPQSSVTFYDLTCRQTLRHMAWLRGMNGHRRVEQAINALMSLFDMEEHADKLMNQLSGGTKRKLSLALAMMCVPPVLLLDEPTAGVDPLSRRSIWQCIVNCKKRHNCSIVISSHAMEECEAICDRIALMANGRLYCLGSFQQLRKKYSQGYVIRVQLYRNIPGPKQTESPVELLSTLDISDRLTVSLKAAIPSIKVEYSNNSIVIFRITDCNEARSKLFRLMDLERDRYLGRISYLINDTSLEDVFLTFARFFEHNNSASDTVIPIAT